MVFFFFVVGMEIKRELSTGELQRPPRRRAARARRGRRHGRAGAALPRDHRRRRRAHGLGDPDGDRHRVRSRRAGAAGDRVPPALRLFLLTIAIVDDIGAIAIIAIFYSEGLSTRLGSRSRSPASSPSSLIQRIGVARVWRVRRRSALLIWVADATSRASTRRSPASRSACSTPARPVPRPRRARAARAPPAPDQRLRDRAAVRARQRRRRLRRRRPRRRALEPRSTWAIVAGLVLGKLLGVAGATARAASCGSAPCPTAWHAARSSASARSAGSASPSRSSSPTSRSPTSADQRREGRHLHRLDRRRRARRGPGRVARGAR